MIPSLVALVLSAVDPCAPVAPVGSPDPAAAEAYRAVGDEELAHGALDPAAAAYRAALTRDPSDGASRDALRRLCEARSAIEDPLARGLRLMDAGEFRGAIDAFRVVRAPALSPSTALLQGICHYELGEDTEAAPLLREAEGYGPHREEARLYLGLISLRAGAGAEATALFESARANPALERDARDLAQLARQDGRVVVSMLAESGWDSNVNLAPNAEANRSFPFFATDEPSIAPESDGVFALTGSLLVRPNGSRGPYLRGAALTHEPFRLGAYRVRGFDAAGGWQLRGRASQAIVEYDYATRTFGGDPYLNSHRLLASGWLRAGRAGFGAAYLVRFESYATEWSRFSGTLQRAELRAAFTPSPQLRVGVAYGIGREDAREPVVSYLEHGPRVELRASAGGAWRLGLDASLSRRGYDEYDSAFQTTRRDTYLDASAFAERDVAIGWALRFGLEGRRALSNVAALEYDKVVPTIGLAYVRGF
jgi:tetratricopeptide (TPR) repeat protein